MPTSSAGRVSRELRGHIILIGLDRTTKRNAFDQAMLDDLVLALGEYERDDNARCALVFAHGEHFTAGLDLAGIGDTFKQGWEMPPGSVDPWRTFGGPHLTKPLMVAVQGYCYTIGIELMLAADINLCASNTRFAQLEVQRGILPFGGATLRLHQIAGWGNAMRWLLTGDEFDAYEAYRLGLVQEVAHPSAGAIRTTSAAETLTIGTRTARINPSCERTVDSKPRPIPLVSSISKSGTLISTNSH